MHSHQPPLATLAMVAALTLGLAHPLNAQSVAPELLQSLKWREVGPSATGGRIVDIEAVPDKPHVIYAAAATSGLWKTTNNGTTWSCVFGNEATLSIGDIALDPRDPETLWLGTGEANNQRSSLWGDGVYKSTDGGQTWKNMGLRDTHHIGRIVVHPQDSDTVYVAALGHLYTENEQRGLFKTTDGGKSWKKVLYISPAVGVVDVVLNPQDPRIVYAASYERLRRAWNFDGAGPGSAIYKSTNGGKRWKRLRRGLPDGEIGRIGLAIYTRDPNILYATISNQNLIDTPAQPGGNRPRTAEEEHAALERELGDEEFIDAAGALPDPSIDEAAVTRNPEDPSRRPPQTDDPQDAQPAETAEPKDQKQELKKKKKKRKRQQAAKATPDPAPTNASEAADTKRADDADKSKPDQSPPTDRRLALSIKRLDELLGLKVEFQEGRVRSVSVDRQGPAARSGMQDGDTLLELAGRQLTDADALVDVASEIRPGDRVVVRYARGDEQLTRSLAVAAPGKRQVGGEIYRSDDAGKTWTKQNDQPVGGLPAYYYGQIHVDPADEKRLYVLSVPLFTSDDGGKTWKNDAARSVHVDHHALWINPRNPNHLLLGNDGGFHLSYDRGKTWDYVFNLPLTQFYAIAADMQQPYHVYGGTQDNGTHGGPSRSRSRSGVGRFDWYRVGGGDGFYVQVDPDDPDIVFFESQFGVLQRWHRRTGERRLIRPPQSDPQGPRDRYNWNSPILMSRHDSRILYFAGHKLFKSYNRGDDWLTISPDLTTADPAKIAGNVPHCTITTMAESPLDRNLLLVGTDDGNVQWTNDGGKTWTNMADRFPLRPSGWWVSRVELSHHDVKRAYVAFTGYREDDFRAFLFATEDRGTTWRPISANLPAEPINVVKEDPRNPRLLYIGTDLGVHVTLDRGTTWLPLMNNLPRVAVHDLLVHPRERDLIIGTHGRGIFITNVSPLQEFSPEVLDKPVHLFSVPPAVAWQSGSGSSISGDRKWMAENPPYGALISYHLKTEVGEKSISLTILDADGQQLRSLKAPHQAGLHTVVWDLRRGNERFPPRTGRFKAVLKVDDNELRREFQVDPDPLVQR